VRASTLDAEERGYFKQFETAVVSPLCRTAIENSFDQAKYRDVQDAKKLATAQRQLGLLIDQVQKIASLHLARVELGLPPEALKDLHLSRVAFLRFAKDYSNRPERPSVDDFIQRCREFYLKNIEVERMLRARPSSPPAKGTIRLTYEPPIGPFSYNLIDGSFTVKQSFATPLGSLTVGYTNAAGAKMLVIRSGGRERYFALDQAFEVFVPATNGLIIRNHAGSAIVLEVVAR